MNTISIISVILVLLTIYELYVYYKMYNTGDKQNQNWALQLLVITISITVISQVYGTQMCQYILKMSK
jgi:hypothetical protein